MIPRVHDVLDDARMRPWASAVALVLLISGLAAAFDVQLHPIFVFDAVVANGLPVWFIHLLALLYALGGLLLLGGMFGRWGNVEAAGCIGVITVSAVRIGVLFGVLGVMTETVMTALLYVVVMAAAAERLWQILHDEQIVAVKKAEMP